MRHHRIELDSIELTEAAVAGQDAVVIVTDHKGVDYELIGRAAALVIDTRNAMARVDGRDGRISKA